MTTGKFFQDVDLANIDTLVTDCDDTLYPGDLKQYPRGTEAALHGRIKQNIKAVVDNDPAMLGVLGVESLDPSTLGHSFPAIVKHAQQQGKGPFNEVLGRFYDVEYNFTPNGYLGSGLIH